MRKVGLWSFYQIESAVPETDPPPGLPSTPLALAEGRIDKTSTVPTSPRRMITRSQDTTFPVGSEQVGLLARKAENQFFSPMVH